MDLGTLEIQIFVSLALVLGAVFVALLTDFLKGNNEALRERNVELVVRQQERERWLGRAAPSPRQPRVEPVNETAEVSGGAPPPGAGPVAPQPKFEKAEPPEIRLEPKPQRWATEAELGEVDDLADRIRKRAAVDPVERPMHFDPSGPAAPELKQPAAEPKGFDEPRAVHDLAQPEEVSSGPVIAELDRMHEAPAAEPEARPVVTPAGFEPSSEELPKPEPPAPAEGIPPEETALEETGEAVPPAETQAPAEPGRSWIERVEQQPGDKLPEAPEIQPAGSGSAEPGESVETAGREQPPEPARAPGEIPPESPAFGKVTPIDVLAANRINLRDSLLPGGDEDRWSGLTSSTEAKPEAGQEAEPAHAADEETTPLPTASGYEAGEPGGAEPPSGRELEQTGSSESPTGGAMEAERTVRIPTAPTRSLGELQLPPGFHDYSVFAEALSSTAVFQGTAVALSVTGADEPDALTQIEEFLRSLLTPVDFACRSGKDEFLLILPGETGAASQRRLQYISQRLWDYQIRSVARHPIMFSWGAADMSGVPLSEVVSAARDRMWQTRRSRERATAELAFYRRVANET